MKNMLLVMLAVAIVVFSAACDSKNIPASNTYVTGAAGTLPLTPQQFMSAFNAQMAFAGPVDAGDEGEPVQIVKFYWDNENNTGTAVVSDTVYFVLSASGEEQYLDSMSMEFRPAGDGTALTEEQTGCLALFAAGAISAVDSGQTQMEAAALCAEIWSNLSAEAPYAAKTVNDIEYAISDLGFGISMSIYPAE